MQLLLRAQFAVWLFIATVWARELHGGTTVDWGTQYVGNGDVHIFSGAIWSIINNAASDFHGNIRVDTNAGLYVSSVSPNVALSATLMDMIYGFVNNGVVSFNAIKGAPGYVFMIMGNKFENNGDLFFSASGEGSVVSGIKSLDWHNNGLIHIYQKMKSDSYTYLGMDAQSIVNNGQICFTNQNWYQLAGMMGSGCITAQGKSSFYFINTNLKISEDEIFYLANGETSIMAVGSINDPQTFHVRGFGTTNGVANKIGLTATLYSSVPGKSPFSYNARDGILTLYVGLYSQNFEIGTGYDFTKFQVVSDTSKGIPGIYLGAVQYNGPPPNPGMPSECKPCKSIPGIPGVDNPPPTYSIETALETSHTTTRKNSDSTTGAETKSTIAKSETSESFDSTTTITDTTTTTETTMVTTTWLVTKSDGSVETETGIVTQSGSSSSTISTFGPPSETDTESYDSTTTITDTTTTTETTMVTTTWLVTKSDGSVETETGIVTQSGSSSSTISTFGPPSETITTSENTSEPTGGASEPTGEPTGNASEPTGNASESTGNASEPTGDASEPTGDAMDGISGLSDYSSESGSGSTGATEPTGKVPSSTGAGTDNETGTTKTGTPTRLPDMGSNSRPGLNTGSKSNQSSTTNAAVGTKTASGSDNGPGASTEADDDNGSGSDNRSSSNAGSGSDNGFGSNAGSDSSVGLDGHNDIGAGVDDGLYVSSSATGEGTNAPTAVNESTLPSQSIEPTSTTGITSYEGLASVLKVSPTTSIIVCIMMMVVNF
ncbi:hypothetical protein CORT_0C02750 [Candida orthopsilosis Co 90-125]|uniref:Hyphally-regulated cell wall protein N-terminal domain-containing protein n=1 Tax=Candida orthopsilosis (strain 90-125) TaxID=1136231 RepID=H8X3L3_CANO9|nr:hypothetical protein CORT_0C02750 [Candida orthopsilosis Co 90-125]CCG25651.1 hypothetical protein CORT_0C02750 [Candida orthopsilosis Co 90-125]